MNESNVTTVLIVDDHELISTTLALSLCTQGFRARRCTVSRPETVLEEAARYPSTTWHGGHGPGLVLLDLDLGTTGEGLPVDGGELIAPLRAAGWIVLVLTGSTDTDRLAAAVAAGAVGWIAKSAPFDLLVQGVLDVLAGRDLLTPTARTELLARHRDHLAAQQEAITRLRRLSTREREVLLRLVDGQQAAAIADEFVTSLATVRAQIRSILAKLEVSSQLAAVALAHRFPGECRTTSKVLQQAVPR